MSSALVNPYKTTRIAETIANYARVDQVEMNPGLIGEDVNKFNAIELYDEGEFWRKVLNAPDDYWGKLFRIYMPTTLSEWVARVPGLYWKKGSEALREVTQSAIETIGNEYVVLQPIGKSQVVLGGVGTVKLPPDINGYRLVTISTGRNASTGIPALIAPEVWDYYRLKEGALLDRISAIWQKMPIEWHQHFPSTRDMPRGCLIIHENEDIRISKNHEVIPILFHPFSVMEYYTDNAILYDFVFVTVTTEQSDYRQRVQDFFEYYRKSNGRNGKYLLEVDISTPLLEAQYLSPAELRKNDATSGPQLDILLSRIRGDTFKGQTIEDIIKAINANYDNKGLERLGSMVDLNPAVWITNESVAKLSIKLLDYCLDNRKVDALLEVIVMDNPSLLSH